MMPLEFSKYSGCGNDFIIIDNRKLVFPANDGALIRKLCHRQLGIGADGLILLEYTDMDKADFRMKIFNSDGNEAEMCGNGLRCFGRFLEEKGINKEKSTVQVMERLYELSTKFKQVQINMGPPKIEDYGRHIQVGTETYHYDFLNTGVPHAVINTKDLENVNVDEIGKNIRHHPDFSPHGTNVSFIMSLDERCLAIRTFERGVEKETLACGTGAAAAAISAGKKCGYAKPIKVITRSGEEIDFSFIISGNKIQDVIMDGPAYLIFKGYTQLFNEKK